MYQCLPDLYRKKYVMSEKLSQYKAKYLPYCNLSNSKNKVVQREYQQWDYVLEEMKLKALEIQQRYKWKIATAYSLAKKSKKKLVKRLKVEEFRLVDNRCLGYIVEKAFVEQKFVYPSQHSSIYMEEEDGKIGQFVSRVQQLNGADSLSGNNLHSLRCQIVKQREQGRKLNRLQQTVLADIDKERGGGVRGPLC